MISQNRLDQLNCVSGLDCSSIQTDINWILAYESGIRFAFFKLTEGTTGKDARLYQFPFKSRIFDAIRNGIKIGYYHFCRPGNDRAPLSDARDEAGNFIDELKRYPKPNFPVCLDLESFSDKYLWQGDRTTAMIKYLNELIYQLKMAGYEVMIYTNQYYWNSNLGTSNYSAYPLFVSNYIDVENSLPLLPACWQNWVIWQYSVAGKYSQKVLFCNGELDLNIMKKDFFEKAK